MPEVLHVRGGGSHDPSLLPLLEAMASEIGNQRVGAATVMTRLADIVMTRVVRAWADSRTEDTTGWLPRYAILKSAKRWRLFTGDRAKLGPSCRWRQPRTCHGRFFPSGSRRCSDPARSIRRAMAYAPGRHVATHQTTDRLRSGDTTQLRIRGLLQPCVQTVHGDVSQHVSPTPCGRGHPVGSAKTRSAHAPRVPRQYT